MLGHVDIRVVQQSSSVDGWEALCQKAGLAQVSVGGSLAEERVGAAQHTSKPWFCSSTIDSYRARTCCADRLQHKFSKCDKKAFSSNCNKLLFHAHKSGDWPMRRRGRLRTPLALCPASGSGSAAPPSHFED